MANLLPGTESRTRFPQLDPQQLARFENRLHTLVDLIACAGFQRPLGRLLAPYENGLEELESESSLVTALDVLDRIEVARRAVIAECRAAHARSSGPPGGALLCYWPGRSLSTGESSVASRGFFDVLDRPPVGFWIEAMARPIRATHEAFELVILAWIPEFEIERASAGCRACTSGSLARLADVSIEIGEQLQPLLEGPAPT